MDFAKKTSRAKKSRKIKFNIKWFIFTLGVFVICGFGYFVYQSLTDENGFLAKNVANAKTWVSERSSNLHKGVVKAKPITVAREEDQQIHFEFYNDLPNAKPVTAEIDPNKEDLTNKRSPKKMIATTAIFVSPEELEKELSEKIRQTKRAK